MDCVLIWFDEELDRGRTGGVGKFFRLNDCESSLAGGKRGGILWRESIYGFDDGGIDRDGGSSGGDGGG
jgi:hypothetical protein